MLNMKDQRKCMVHFEDKSALEDSGRFLARIPRGLGLILRRPWLLMAIQLFVPTIKDTM